jgi:hypothetical protein
MLGRTVGLAYVVPLTYYLLRKRLPREMYGRFAFLLGLGAAQGGIGWWMVRSGLEEHGKEQLEKRSEVRVSPYRLATHVSSFLPRFVSRLSLMMRPRFAAWLCLHDVRRALVDKLQPLESSVAHLFGSRHDVS